MPAWMPQPVWSGEEAFILGGGNSLQTFDWNLLRREHVVGCNQAFRLGPEICDYVIFCDHKFIKESGRTPRTGVYDQLAVFPNPVVTNDPALRNASEPWLKWMPRRPTGLHRDALGYNFNTGAAAINLALLLGATTIYLLGFDMQLGPGRRPNWHNHLIDKPSPGVYDRMIRSFVWVNQDLHNKFPDCRIFNVTRGSRLEVFPKLDFETFWRERAGVAAPVAAV